MSHQSVGNKPNHTRTMSVPPPLRFDVRKQRNHQQCLLQRIKKMCKSIATVVPLVESSKFERVVGAVPGVSVVDNLSIFLVFAPVDREQCS
jgi:hypothetical protein